jgi:hypothetical protein
MMKKKIVIFPVRFFIQQLRQNAECRWLQKESEMKMFNIFLAEYLFRKFTILLICMVISVASALIFKYFTYGYWMGLIAGCIFYIAYLIFFDKWHEKIMNKTIKSHLKLIPEGKRVFVEAKLNITYKLKLTDEEYSLLNHCLTEFSSINPSISTTHDGLVQKLKTLSDEELRVLNLRQNRDKPWQGILFIFPTFENDPSIPNKEVDHAEICNKHLAAIAAIARLERMLTYIRETIKERKLSRLEVAKILNVDLDTVDMLIDGKNSEGMFNVLESDLNRHVQKIHEFISPPI